MNDKAANNYSTIAVHQLDVGLTDAEALAGAQFLKRAGFSEFRACAVDDDEAHLIKNAMIKLQKAFDLAGYSPR